MRSVHITGHLLSGHADFYLQVCALALCKHNKNKMLLKYLTASWRHKCTDEIFWDFDEASQRPLSPKTDLKLPQCTVYVSASTWIEAYKVCTKEQGSFRLLPNQLHTRESARRLASSKALSCLQVPQEVLSVLQEFSADVEARNRMVELVPPGHVIQLRVFKVLWGYCTNLLMHGVHCQQEYHEGKGCSCLPWSWPQ